MGKSLKKLAKNIGVEDARTHIFICAEPQKAKCCDRKVGQESWDYLKKRLKQLGLAERGGVLRTKADCLRVCERGPIAVVYPDGIWYHSMTVENLERVITEHLVEGNPVEEFIFERNPLG